MFPIENSDSNDFDIRSSIVLTISIAAYSVCVHATTECCDAPLLSRYCDKRRALNYYKSIHVHVDPDQIMQPTWFGVGSKSNLFRPADYTISL